MGCEGGSIEGRQEVVKLKAKPERVDPNQVNLIRWTLCALSQMPLKGGADDVVCDYIGNLYNRDAVVTHLVSKEVVPRFAHLTSIHAVLTVKLVWNEERKGTGSLQGAIVRYFVCPITNVPGNGRFAFVVRPKCGCVFSRKAMVELPPCNNCLACGVPAEPLLIPVLPDNSEIKTLRLNFQKMKAQRRASKLQRNGIAVASGAIPSDHDEKSSSSSSTGMDVEGDEKHVQNGKRKSVTVGPTTATTTSSFSSSPSTSSNFAASVSVSDRTNGIKKSKQDGPSASHSSAAAMSVAREAELAVKARIGANATFQSLFRAADATRTMSFISTKQDIV